MDPPQVISIEQIPNASEGISIIKQPDPLESAIQLAVVDSEDAQVGDEATEEVNVVHAVITAELPAEDDQSLSQPASDISPDGRKMRWQHTVKPNTDPDGLTRYAWPDDVMNNDEIPVYVGTFPGTFSKSRIGSARRGKCIRVDDEWLTPNEFEKRSGCVKFFAWRKNIRVYGKPLLDLFIDGIVRPHSRRCGCPNCGIKEGTSGRIVYDDSDPSDTEGATNTPPVVGTPVKRKRGRPRKSEQQQRPRAEELEDNDVTFDAGFTDGATDADTEDSRLNRPKRRRVLPKYLSESKVLPLNSDEEEGGGVGGDEEEWVARESDQEEEDDDREEHAGDSDYDPKKEVEFEDTEKPIKKRGRPRKTFGSTPSKVSSSIRTFPRRSFRPKPDPDDCTTERHFDSLRPIQRLERLTATMRRLLGRFTVEVAAIKRDHASAQAVLKPPSQHNNKYVRNLLPPQPALPVTKDSAIAAKDSDQLVCANCNRRDFVDEALTCPNCCRVFYCSAFCFERDWRFEHHRKCGLDDSSVVEAGQQDVSVLGNSTLGSSGLDESGNLLPAPPKVIKGGVKQLVFLNNRWIQPD